MADNIFTRALAQAMAIHDSTQALAYALRVPEPTLLRWLAGRAQMPHAAFRHLMGILVEHERRFAPQLERAADSPPPPAALKIGIGDVLAQCERCQGEEFVPSDAPVRVTSVLSCASCRSTVVHAELLTRLATQATKRAHNGKAPGRPRAAKNA